MFDFSVSTINPKYVKLFSIKNALKMKQLVTILLLFTITFSFSQTMVGATYDEVITKYSGENLKPMHSIYIGNREYKSLLLVRKDYRVNFTFNESEICNVSTIIFINYKTLKSYINYFNKNFTATISNKKWVNSDRSLCIELFYIGNHPNIRVSNECIE